jgi:hypothetical protein
MAAFFRPIPANTVSRRWSSLTIGSSPRSPRFAAVVLERLACRENDPRRHVLDEAWSFGRRWTALWTASASAINLAGSRWPADAGALAVRPRALERDPLVGITHRRRSAHPQARDPNARESPTEAACGDIATRGQPRVSREPEPTGRERQIELLEHRARRPVMHPQRPAVQVAQDASQTLQGESATLRREESTVVIPEALDQVGEAVGELHDVRVERVPLVEAPWRTQRRLVGPLAWSDRPEQVVGLLRGERPLADGRLRAPRGDVDRAG